MENTGGGVGGGTPTNPKGSKKDRGTQNPTDGSKPAGSADREATVAIAVLVCAVAGVLSGLQRRSR